MDGMRVAKDYSSEITGSSLSALVELYTILGRYKDALDVMGGWAPYLLLQRFQREENPFVHVGSVDIDIAVDPARIDAETYATIVELIQKRDYAMRLDAQGNPTLFSFAKTIQADHGDFKVQVDFLTAPVPRSRKHRHHQLQADLNARQARGCEVIFKHHFQHKVTATLPGNGQATVEIPVADVAGILATKGIALGERYKEKDAYDIFAVVANYQDGPRSVAEKLEPAMGEPALQEALRSIGAAFASPKANGPSWVATFLGAAPREQRDRVRADAYMNVNELLKLLGQA